jgi:bacterioferritin-associated ferredoxin
MSRPCLVTLWLSCPNVLSCISVTPFAQSVLTIIRIRVHNTAMIVCVCKAVSDRHIRSAVKDGASCMRDLTRELGIGACCGKCVPEARRVLSDSLPLGTASSSGLLVPALG